MKKAAWILVWLSCTPLLAQTRIIPHLTRADGGFTSTLNLANASGQPQTVQLIGYTEQGEQVAVMDQALDADAVLQLDPVQFFNRADVSHVRLEGSEQVVAGVAYVAQIPNSGPAQVLETNQSGPNWRLYPGNNSVTWDGVALVNLGERPAEVAAEYRAADGSLLARQTLASEVASMAKILAVLSDNPASGNAATIDIRSDQPLALTALRGNLAREFLWENRAFEFEPSLARSKLKLVNVFPRLFFDAPVDIQSPPDQSNRMFIVQKGGLIRVVPDIYADNPQPEVFLDVSGLVSTASEMGLLGMAFHPQFANNGLFYVNYATERNGPRRTMIVEYQVSDNANQADPQSARTVLQVEQPEVNHNGGQLVFGPDGMLYIGLGDGGGGGDPFRTAQDMGSLLGKMLRIDVDNQQNGLAYAIPADNPFVNTGGARAEIYALGLRNPWRYSFGNDRGEVKLWCADVGQSGFEEVDIIESGGNYGWSVMEASACFRPTSGCSTNGLTLPIFEYDHRFDDKSITGGFVYSGQDLPMLRDYYVYGDFVSGRVWALQRDASGMAVNLDILTSDPDRQPASFGIDRRGELYLASIRGIIYRFAPDLEPTP